MVRHATGLRQLTRRRPAPGVRLIALEPKILQTAIMAGRYAGECGDEPEAPEELRLPFPCTR